MFWVCFLGAQIHGTSGGVWMSGTMAAMADIAALSLAREAEAQEAAEEAAAEPDESAQKRRKLALSKSLSQN